MNRFDLAAQSADHRLWDWDLTTSRIHYSPGWISMLGCEGAEFGNSPEEWFRRIHPEDSESVQREIRSHLAQGSAQFEIEHRMLHNDGCYRWMSCQGMITRDTAGQAIRVTGFHLDITADKVVDPLTGLPNRLLLLDRLARSIEKARRREDFIFAVLIIDLDLFESGVDRLETTNADPLIIAAARRLETSLRSAGNSLREGRAHLVARSGGEEFIILLEGLSTLGEVRKISDQLLKAILAPFEYNGRNVFLSPSIGIALSATGYRSAKDVLRDADTALYRAKSLGKSRCEIFDTAVVEFVQTRTQLEQDLQEALNRREFLVYYQPIVSLSTNRIAGFEALVRWNHPSRGMVSPMEFIPVAEKTGLIIPLDRWVLQEACRQLKTWKENPQISKELWVSVNITGTQFMQPSLANDIRGILLELDFDASGLVLELTEGVVMEKPEAARALLMQLRAMGARIALDDFGTGYSSLAHLRRFPLDYLKIDYSFVRSIESSPDTMEIIRAISVLSRQLGLHVVAEGIESSRQLELLRSLECEYGQGFLYSRAVDAQKAEQLLLEGFPEKASDRGEPVTTDPVLPDLNSPLNPEAARKPRFIWDPKHLWAGIAAILLIAGILASTWNQNPLQPSAVKPQPNSPPAVAELSRPAEAPAVTGKEIVPERPQGPAAVMPKAPGLAAESGRKPAEAAVLEFALVHDHVVGSCSGNLKLLPDKISYTSEKAKDSFDCPYAEITFALKKDRLAIKAGSRTYHFKSAAALSEEENLSLLSEIYRILSSRQE